ncbi:MAG TPA: class I SAM-dependent DNA methyltransferase, partial [Planctomycetaceae bacterium]|nr:class I SAM-dependent DNA methyltransferase [Planctomycetaceae bacterium]
KDERAHRVAQFLMRCLFTMFAEDVELIPKGSFAELLESLRETPENFGPMMEALWQTMDKGGFSPILRQKILQFNGGLFADCSALPLNRDQLELLIEAARSNWAEVEPAIFGTLLERALDPVERHKLGAHYTPRAYVERLVMPTLIEPLRNEWDTAYATAVALYEAGKTSEAQKTVREFHEKLCHVRVLDPACGSGNFLYVALELMKRLEGEVTKAMADFGDRQKIFTTIDPHQFMGIEVNPRAAAIADLVLWIGYLQWHIRALGRESISEPIIRKFDNIECRDAVLAWDSIEPVFDADGKPVTRWDGRTTKRHPVTGEEVPDENARVQELRYINPRKADWPQVDYILGNPPFIGNKKMRFALGDGYVEALRATLPNVPDNVDYVVYWWEQAGTILGKGHTRRFGLITTNSITQSSNRRVIQSVLDGQKSLGLVFATPDHPWVDDGADVRIAMSVVSVDADRGTLLRITREEPGEDAEVKLELAESFGPINANLTIGANVDASVPLMANRQLSFMGVTLVGEFRLEPEELEKLGQDREFQPLVVKPYLAGKAFSSGGRERYVIDLFGMSENDVRTKLPSIYQRLLEFVKPLRDENKRETYRKNWWVFGEPRPAMRYALSGLTRYIATAETSKFRIFDFLAPDVVPDHSLFVVADDDAYPLGVLSSRVHATWASAAGARMGVGNDLRYRNVNCFLPFAFPSTIETQQRRIRELAEQLDAHRKRQQVQHAGLSMTGMYNVLEKLRSGEELTAKEKLIHEKGLVSVLKQIHDELDTAVFDAYGWPHDLTDEEILER